MLGGCGAESARSTGYTMTLPDGWEDVTRDIETRSGSDFDAVYEGPADRETRVSVSVALVPAREGVSLEEITRDGRSNLRRAFGRTSTIGEPVEDELAGEPALRFDYDLEESRVRQLGALHGGSFYLVSFTADRAAFDRRLPLFEGILRSWRWE